MKHLVFLLLILAACGQDTSDFMQKPGASAKTECPIYKKGQLLPIAKITFETELTSEEKRLEEDLHPKAETFLLTSQDQSILSEVAQMHYRCGGNIRIEGYRLTSEDKDYGLLRAGIVFKELEKNGVADRFMTFKQKAGEKTDVVISLQM